MKDVRAKGEPHGGHQDKKNKADKAVQAGQKDDWEEDEEGSKSLKLKIPGGAGQAVRLARKTFREAS